MAQERGRNTKITDENDLIQTCFLRNGGGKKRGIKRVKASEGLCIEEHFLTCCLKSHTVSVAVQMFGYICIIFTLHHSNSGHQPTILKKLTSTVLNLIKFLSFTMCILLPGKTAIFSKMS